MKKCFIIFLLFFANSFLLAQGITVTAGNVPAVPGSDIVVPVNVTGFTDVGAFTIVIQFDKSVITWDGAANWNPLVSSALAPDPNSSISKVTLGWASDNAVNIGSGKLVDLRFKYISGSSSISFETATCEIANNAGNVINTNYTSGSVTPNVVTYTLTINKNGNGTGQVKVNEAAHNLPYTATFNSGDVVNLQAVAGTGSRFESWGGNLSGTTNPTTITIDGNKTVSAGFTIEQYQLQINKTGNGSGQVKVNSVAQNLPYSGMFEYNSVVNVEVVPSNGSRFNNWSGDLTGNTNPTSITMTGNKTVSADLSLIQYTLTISKGGNGDGQIKINDGTPHALPYSGDFDYGTVVKVEAVAGANCAFGGWSGDLTGNTNPVTITISSAKTVTAAFNEAYTLSISNGGNGAGQIIVNDVAHDLPYTVSISKGSQVKLQASPSTGSRFDGWGGDLTGITNPSTITMDGNKSITETLILINYLLTLNAGGNGKGKVKVNNILRTLPYSGNFDYGTVVNLEAVPDTNNSFVGWSGDITGKTNPSSVTIYANKTISVGFSLNKKTLVITKDGNGSGQVKVNDSLKTLPYSDTFDYGTQINLEAVPDANSSFIKWTGDLTGTSNPVSIIITENKSITAEYNLRMPVMITLLSPADGATKIPVDAVLSWKADTKAFGYNLQVSDDESFSSLVVDLNNSSGKDTNYTLTGLNYKTKYFWRVRGIRNGMYGVFSDVWTFITKCKPVRFPSDLTVESIGNNVVLNWKDNSDNELGFAILRKGGDTLNTGSPSLGGYIILDTVGVNKTSYTDASISLGIAYSYKIYAFSADTISESSNEGSVVTAVNELIKPEKFQVTQNYPNPFNPATVIRYALPKQSSVKICIYNSLGELMEIVENCTRSVGYHEVSWKAGNLSSGIYFYVIDAKAINSSENYHEVKKMLLMK